MIYCAYLSIVIGVIGIISGAVTADFDKYSIKKELTFTDNSSSYNHYEDTPLYTKTFMKVYYFDCVNAEAVMNDKVKPLLRQVGPYTFREEREKTDITFSPDGNLVDFKWKKTWFFDPALSNGSLDDEIWTLNVIAVSAAESTRWPGRWGQDDYPFMQYMMNDTLKQENESLFMRARIGNLTFDGLDSPLIQMGDLGGDIGDAINASIPYDRFGWFYSRNMSSDYEGQYQMFTGEDLINKAGQISQWNSLSDLSYLYPQPCDQLYGSVGEFFPKERNSISLFSSDLCRPVFFNYKEDTEVSGIPGFKYWLDSMFIGNATTNTSNSCYNPEPDLVINYPDLSYATINETLNMPLINGLLNISACQKWSAGTYVSLPHFYLADPVLLDQFDERSDLHPNEEDHSSYMSIMQGTDIPLESALRFQINILYRPLPWIKIFEDLPPTFYPAMWYEVTSELAESDDGAEYLQSGA